jgi:hypothetical protein
MNTKTILVAALLSTVASTALAQPTGASLPDPEGCDPCHPQLPLPARQAAQTDAGYAQPDAGQPYTGQPYAAQPGPSLASAPAPDAEDSTDEGWHRPAGRRFSHGFRLGWTYIQNYDKATRDNGMSIKEEFKLKTPNMMLLGYEGFYRIVGHSWLNVLMVGNVSVAGLEQSKFIPAASGLIGFEIDRSFQLGVGVNLTPDPQAPSHMIAAAGWTPRVGAIQTPLHFFYVPDAAGNNRMGATIGMNW